MKGMRGRFWSQQLVVSRNNIARSNCLLGSSCTSSSMLYVCCRRSPVIYSAVRLVQQRGLVQGQALSSKLLQSRRASRGLSSQALLRPSCRQRRCTLKKERSSLRRHSTLMIQLIAVPTRLPRYFPAGLIY